jgi:hypothetical protein
MKKKKCIRLTPGWFFLVIALADIMPEKENGIIGQIRKDLFPK